MFVGHTCCAPASLIGRLFTIALVKRVRRRLFYCRYVYSASYPGRRRADNADAPCSLVIEVTQVFFLFHYFTREVGDGAYPRYELRHVGRLRGDVLYVRPE